MPAELILHQFPISHYCEKVRWILDHKRLPYRVHNQFPGLHARHNQRRVGRASVPVLVDGHHAIGNSSDIALYLDDQFPEPKLIPSEPAARAEVLALEAFFDDAAGVYGRRYIYSYVLRDPKLFERVFFPEYSRRARFLGKLTAGPLTRRIAAMYDCGPEAIESSLAQVERALARLEELTGGDSSRYLVGDTFTLADITAASMLGPLLSPPGTPWVLDFDIPALSAYREQLAARPAGRWVLARFAHDRRRSA